MKARYQYCYDLLLRAKKWSLKAFFIIKKVVIDLWMTAKEWTLKTFFKDKKSTQKKRKKDQTKGLKIEAKRFFRLFPEIQKEDYDFISDSKAAVLTKSHPLVGIILYTVMILIATLLLWAYFAPIDQITVGEGKVIPSSEVKIIQSLDGGIISTINVHEGELLKKGQLLLTFDATRYKSDYEQGLEKHFSLTAAIVRLTAEIQGLDSVVFPDELKNHPDLMAFETKLFDARRRALNEEVDVLNQNYRLAQQELKMYQPLVKKGVVAKIDYYRSERAANEIKRTIMNLEDKYKQDALTELNQKKSDLAVLNEQLTSLKDKMLRTSIYSPVNGIVKTIYIHTIGAVLQSGQPILEIVPVEDSLLIQAKIKPSDIAFIKLGQPATVKITAYDYSIYGSLYGTVEYISADTMDETKANTPEERAEINYYIINVRTKKINLGSESNKLPIIPGMNATVHIKTGQKTILEYILKPLIKAKQESLRER